MMREYIVRETDCGLATKQEVVGELVRCKECKWWEEKDIGLYGYCYACYNRAYRNGIVFRVSKDDFCAYGDKGDKNAETD